MVVADPEVRQVLMEHVEPVQVHQHTSLEETVTDAPVVTLVMKDYVVFRMVDVTAERVDAVLPGFAPSVVKQYDMKYQEQQVEQVVMEEMDKVIYRPDKMVSLEILDLLVVALP